MVERHSGNLLDHSTKNVARDAVTPLSPGQKNGDIPRFRRTAEGVSGIKVQKRGMSSIRTSRSLAPEAMKLVALSATALLASLGFNETHESGFAHGSSPYCRREDA
jgi:hypothetical protein